MSWYFYSWLVVVIGSGIFCMAAKDDKWRKNLFLVVLTAFVAQSLTADTLKTGKSSYKQLLVTSRDQAELLLRLDSAYQVLVQEVSHSAAGLAPGNQINKLNQRDFQKEASKILVESIKKDPDPTVSESKLVVVLGHYEQFPAHQKIVSLCQKLISNPASQSKNLGKTLLSLYSGDAVNLTQATQVQSVINESFKPGWYRDAALLHLYKVTGQKHQFLELEQTVNDKAVRLLINFTIAITVISLLGFVGSIVVLVQLFFLPRKISTTALDPMPWNFGLVWGVFMGWLATQIAIGQLLHGVLKSQHLFSSGPLLAAVTTAVLYIVSNGPALAYVYWFACKQKGLKFTEAVGLKLATKKLNLWQLIGVGLCAWMAAIPIVVLSYVVAMRFLGAQGSSNPIIALVLDAARVSNPLATAIFYLTLGVIAPICEEVLFRGFLYRSLRNKFGVGVSLFVSAAVFAAVHLDIGAFVPLFCLGWIFGFVYERTRSLLPSMIAHGLWNSGTFTFVLLIFGS